MIGVTAGGALWLAPAYTAGNGAVEVVKELLERWRWGG